MPSIWSDSGIADFTGGFFGRSISQYTPDLAKSSAHTVHAHSSYKIYSFRRAGSDQSCPELLYSSDTINLVLAVNSEPRPSSRLIGQLRRLTSLLVCLSCLSTGEAWPELASGTIVVVTYSKQKAILAADSRVNFGDGKYDDSYCKVTALSDRILFTATGIVGDSSYLLPEDLRFSALEEAKRVFADVSKSPSSALRPPYEGIVGELATDWGLAMTARFNQASQVRLKEWLRRVSPSGERAFVIGIFAGQDSDGQVRVKAAHVTYREPKKDANNLPIARFYMLSTESTSDDATITDAFGMPEVVQQINSGKVEVAASELGPLPGLSKATDPAQYDRLRTIKLVELTIAHHPKREFLGGKIDAAEIVRGGVVRWIQRKENCPAI